MSRVVVLGNATVDIILRLAAFPRPGETVLCESLLSCAGGKGLNQAVAAARTGAETVLVAALGDDANGAFLRAALAGETGLAARWQTRPTATDVSTIWIDAGGENVIASSAESAGALTPADAELLLAELAAGDILLMQGNLAAGTTMAAARQARARGAAVILNSAPIAWPMAPLLPLVDVLVCNEVEAAQLTGGAADPLAAPELAAPGTLLLTRGGAGADLRTSGRTRRIPAPAVEVVDTAGAGDVTVGTLAGLMAAGLPATEAARVAVAAASLSVTRAGTTPSFPTRSEIAGLRRGLPAWHDMDRR